MSAHKLKDSDVIATAMTRIKLAVNIATADTAIYNPDSKKVVSESHGSINGKAGSVVEVDEATAKWLKAKKYGFPTDEPATPLPVPASKRQ